MKQKQYTVEMVSEPQVYFVDFEGAHLPLTGALGFMFNLSRAIKGEETAISDFYEFLKAEKRVFDTRVEMERAKIATNNPRPDINPARGIN